MARRSKCERVGKKEQQHGLLLFLSRPKLPLLITTGANKKKKPRVVCVCVATRSNQGEKRKDYSRMRGMEIKGTGSWGSKNEREMGEKVERKKKVAA